MHPAFVYIARDPCGCVFGVVTDYQDAQTGKVVANFIGSGGTVQRHSWAEYKEIAKEETFLDCPHGQLRMAI